MPRRPSWLSAWPLSFILLFLLLFFLFPVAQLLWLSLLDPQGRLSLHHYARLFESRVYVDVLLNTFRISLWTTALSLLAGYPVAYLLATTTKRTRSMLVLWVLMPFWTSFLVRTFAWMVLLGRNGAINGLLKSLGIVDVPIDIMHSFAAVMIGMCHALMPLAVLTMLAVMEPIDPNLVKAATTLGARGSQAFWRIYFPLSLPGVAAAGLLVFITSLGFFITPALLGGRKEAMIAQTIIFQVEEMLNWGLAGAIAVMLLAVTFLVFYIYDRILGITTLTGETPSVERVSGDAGSFFQRAVRYMGDRLIATLGWTCSAVGALADRIWPRPVHRARHVSPRFAVWGIGIPIVLFLALPSFFVIPVSFTEGEFIEWPPEGFSLQWYREYLASPIWRAATLRSFVVGILTATLSMLIGVPAAFVLARHRLAGRMPALIFILAPLILPHIIIAVALFYLYSKIGLVGTSLGLILGHTVFAVPFVVVVIMAVLKQYDERLDQAAGSLGANRAQTLRHVTLPLMRTGLIAGFVFAFVKSFDELTVALFISSGLDVTLPRQMWSDAVLKVNPTLTAASTIVLVFVTAAILFAEYLNRRGVAK